MKNSFHGKCACGAPGIYVGFEGNVKTGKRVWFCNEHRDDYDAHKDVQGSFKEAYAAIRERMRKGGPGWSPR
jgi:hypothetical protein